MQRFPVSRSRLADQNSLHAQKHHDRAIAYVIVGRGNAMSSARLRSDFWVSAYIRRCAAENVIAVLRRRGASEAGAIYIKLDCLDGTAKLFGPAPQSLMADGDERCFIGISLGEDTPLAAEEKLQRELKFDSDLWIVEVEDRAGRHFLDLAEG